MFFSISGLYTKVISIVTFYRTKLKEAEQCLSDINYNCTFHYMISFKILCECLNVHFTQKYNICTQFAFIRYVPSQATTNKNNNMSSNNKHIIDISKYYAVLHNKCLTQFIITVFYFAQAYL